jgi:hypothetical protein
MKKIMLVVLVSFFVCGCSETQINEETPYTGQIKEIRSYYKAVDIQNQSNGKLKLEVLLDIAKTLQINN